MTSDAERDCYYRLAKEAARKGTIIELGAWLGASTAYIAAGIRDSGVKRKAVVLDQFKSKPGHIQKVKAFYRKRGLNKAPVGPSIEAFIANMGGLLKFVDARPGRIEETIKGPWVERSVALLISDAPKRVPQISAVLTAIAKAMQPGAIMAWQDFCHFPSYEIPACLYRIRHHLEFVEAVVPGSTLVFRVKSQWTAEEVSEGALSLDRWNAEEITAAWDYWLGFMPDAKAAMFMCGEALFLCDIGKESAAVSRMEAIYREVEQAVDSKWRYLRDSRPDFLTRYAPLFEFLDNQEALA